MRPILQAMERSIDKARRERLDGTDAPAAPRPMSVEHQSNGDGEIPRRKARPKRATPPVRQPGGSEYRAKAV
jgi:hypothetical protein